MNSILLQQYFERFGYCDQILPFQPPPALGIVVVIPCFNEPHLNHTLESLWNCHPPASSVEIIVVINSGESAPPGIREQNEKTLIEAEIWCIERNRPAFQTHLIHAPNLPRKSAGVGLARKIGMDEALRRFHGARRPDGIIACFDADSTCDPNYLVELETYFQKHPNSPGCSIYFEHPLQGDRDPRISEAITLYELHLRYYVEGLRHAQFPHAFHTIGSSMAVRAETYLKQGGMNKRRAGEDFYFLHKIIPLGGFGELNTTRVVPSPRVSDRVPFGTGKAVGDYLKGDGTYATYPARAFLDLRSLFSQVPALFESAPVDLPDSLQEFLVAQSFVKKLEELRANTSSPATFTSRFFRWFDGFMAMKFIHFARDNKYGPASLMDALGELYQEMTGEKWAGNQAPKAWLDQFRERQRTRIGRLDSRAGAIRAREPVCN